MKKVGLLFFVTMFVTSIFASENQILISFVNNSSVNDIPQQGFRLDSHQQLEMYVGSKEYGEGWKAGYVEGWKYIKGKNSLTPLVPLTPLPKLGKDTYQDGYNDGFVAGIAKANGR